MAGEIVCLGDKVQCAGGCAGVVKEIVPAGTELAKESFCDNGGVMIVADWDGLASPRVFCLPGDEEWDDVALLGRAGG